MASLWNTVAGVYDHSWGSIDESVGRQFDDQPGGGFADVTETGETNDPETDTYNNRYLQGETVREVYDTVFEYDGTLNGTPDSTDVMGPGLWGSEGSVADVVVEEDGEDHGSEEIKTRLLIYGAAVLLVLWVLSDYVDLAADLAGGKS